MANKYVISTIFKAKNEVSKVVDGMRSSVNRFTISAESGLRKIDNATEKLQKGLLSVGKSAAKGASGVAAAAIIGTSAINVQAAETANMAKAMGANITTVEAVSSAISGIGLNAESVTDLYEEMNNKFGESAGLEEIASVTESLGILGLRFEDIKKLSPENQFLAITDATLKMKNAIEAQAAADILMGAEANKIVGTLRQQGKSMSEIIGNHKMLSFRTEESRKGALDHAAQLSKTGKITKSLGQEISGLAGKHMAPLLEKFNEFMISNKELIGQNIDKLFNKISGSIGDVSTMMSGLITWIGNLGTNFEKVLSWAEWIGKITLAVGALMVGLNLFIGIMTAVNLVMAANPVVLMTAAVIGLGAAFAVAATMVYDNWGGIKDYFKDLFSSIVSMYDSTVGVVMSKVQGVGEFFGIVDAPSNNVNTATQVSAENVVTPQERVSRTYRESNETFNINVRGENGATVSSDRSSPRLNMVNMGA